MKVKCIVPQCLSNSFNHPFQTFPFPKITYNKVNQNQPNLVSLRRIKLWKTACKLPDDYDIEATEPRICYRHFINEKPAKKMQMNDVDWVPTLNLEGESVEGEAENAENRQKILNSSIEQRTDVDGRSYLSLKTSDNNESNTGLCTMVIDQETGDVIFVEPEERDKNIDEISPEAKPQRKRKGNLRKSSTLTVEKKKPKILNRDAPQESEDEVETTPVASVFNHQSSQTDLTMKRIEQLEAFWKAQNEVEETTPTRKSGRNRRKQKL